jgi:hypothetical protein
MVFNMNYAVVLNDIVINVVVWDGVSDWSPIEGVAILIPEETVVLIGFLYAEGLFIDPVGGE